MTSWYDMRPNSRPLPEGYDPCACGEPLHCIVSSNMVTCFNPLCDEDPKFILRYRARDTLTPSDLPHLPPKQLARRARRGAAEAPP